MYYCKQNVTEGKGSPSWLTDDDLHRLNSLADFSMSLMFNSREKKRISAGELYCLIYYSFIQLWRERERETDRDRDRDRQIDRQTDREV